MIVCSDWCVNCLSFCCGKGQGSWYKFPCFGPPLAPDHPGLDVIGCSMFTTKEWPIAIRVFGREQFIATVVDELKPSGTKTKTKQKVVMLFDDIEVSYKRRDM